MGYVLERRQDIIAGLVTGAIGIFIIVEASGYQMGNLRNMGPGYFPVTLGCIMLVLSLVMIVTAQPGKMSQTLDGNQMRGMLFIAAAFIAFALTIETAGMLVSVALAVFLSSLANRNTSLIAAVVLAVATAVMCALIFRVGLGLQIKAY